MTTVNASPDAVFDRHLAAWEARQPAPESAVIHELKCWPPYFAAALDGSKTFELRKADRPFAVGHLVRLREWQQPIPDWDVKGGYTGREVTRSVSYVLDDAEDFGLAPGFVVLGLTPEPAPESWGQRVETAARAMLDVAAQNFLVEDDRDYYRRHAAAALTADAETRDGDDGVVVECECYSPNRCGVHDGMWP